MMETKAEKREKVGGRHGERQDLLFLLGLLSGLEGSSRFNRMIQSPNG